MKNQSKLLFLFASLVLYTINIFPQENASKKTIAVATFDAKGVSKEQAQIVTDLFRSHLVKNGTFEVLDRTHVEKTLKELEFQQSGVTTQDGAVQLGKMLNAAYMIYGSLAKLEQSYVLSVDMVDIAQNKIIKSAQQKFTHLDNSDIIVKNLVQNLLKGDKIESYVDNVPKDPEAIRQYLEKKYLQNDAYHKYEVVGFFHDYDGIQKKEYAYLVYKEIKMPSREVHLHVRSNVSIGLHLYYPRLKKRSEKAFKDKQDYFLMGYEYKPKNQNPFTLLCKVYQKNGTPEYLEFYLVTRNDDWSGRKPVIFRYSLKDFK